MLAHASNLSIESLSQNDAKQKGTHFFYRARLRHGIEDGDPVCHPSTKRPVYTFVDFDDVLLFMVVTGASILLTISPSFVRKMSPSLGLSKRPMGKIRVG